MPLQIVQRYAIQQDGKKETMVPVKLLQVKDGVNYIRMQGSNWAVTKMVYGDGCPKNASISESSVLRDLKKERNEKCGLKAVPDEADQLFNADQPAKKKKTSKKDLPPFITTSHGIQILTPSRASDDVCVRLEASDLDKVIAMILEKEPEEKLLEASKRAYVKSGKYKLSPRSSVDEAEGEPDESDVAEDDVNE